MSGWSLSLVVVAAVSTQATAATERTLVFTPTTALTVADVAELVYGNASEAALIAAANPLASGAAVNPGQEVRVPVSHKIQVRRVTSVGSLAKRHLKGRHRAAILAAVNNLKPTEAVKALTVITVPAVVWHVVQKGETMRSLSRLYYHDSDGRWLLRQANGGRATNRLEQGEMIAIPIFAPWSDVEAVEARLRAAGGAPVTPIDAGVYDGGPGLDAHVASAAQSTPAALELAMFEPEAAVGDHSVTRSMASPLIRYGVDLYRRGDFLAAVAYFRRALLDPTLAPELRIAAYVWLGSSYVAVEETERAEEAMRAALRADPELVLDPAYTSPKILQVLERVRGRGQSAEAAVP